jgi:general secretion pathway protein G
MSFDLQRVDRRPRDERDAGFTLVELLVVLGILAMLATFTGPQVLKYLGKARTDSARIQINAIVSALELYAVDVGQYPAPDTGLGALMQPPGNVARWSGPYLKKAEGLLDPWGRPYGYRIVAQSGQVAVFTLGRDNAAGGVGEDQDVSN